ncbi:MAG: aminopeptidase P family protein [Planctomycetes bacterium]|nr:aminopeptidase P family protein [Planctomycetota bacterium]
MPSVDFHRRRRAALLQRLDHPVVLFAGGFRARNYPANPYAFRADSSFLYLFDRPEPDAAALFDPADGTVRLFVHERTAQDALWHGAQPSFEELRALQGVDEVLAIERLEEVARRIAGGRSLGSLAVAHEATTRRAAALTGERLDFESPDGPGSRTLVDALAELRMRKEPEELAEIGRAAAVTRDAHVGAMAATRVGGSEAHLNGVVDSAFAFAGCTSAYPNILSVRGEVLHNHHHGNALRDGDLVLLDAGAERATGYCADVTRTWPVNGRFGSEQAEIYDIVLAANRAAIAAVKPGVRYMDIHRTSCRVIADGLVQMGLMTGNVDGLVESGAHAVFYPHGVGHMLGIDVHDMEGFGDRIHYPNGRKRSTQFGTAFVRMDRDLEVGNVFTIEPGIYFVPAILHEPELRMRFEGSVDYAAAERFLAHNDGRGFGGIRIEDDVLCTAGGPQILTSDVPKDRQDVEAVVGSAAEGTAR